MDHQENRIFALDIGTRSVVGIVLEVSQTADGPSYKLLGTEMEEHQVRSMMDGQIHHVAEVAKVITHVKEKMEKKFGPFHEVAVAAAGRSLKTKRVSYQKEIKGEPPLDADRILAMELSAVQQAQYLLATEGSKEAAQYYCVGYSLLSSSIDGMPIGHLLDQRGEVAEVEILSTFLPRIVVDNLIAALQRAGLTMSALTLEPIAAIHVLIPPTMRRLNLALVDIGAGTSDIAITDEGTVVAYGMVPIAGDEITDAISQKYLLDFSAAEKVKRKLREEEELSFTDILGLSYQMKRSDILLNISEEINRLVRAIGEKILELNNKPPQAVILIGGGSLLPTLDAKLAEFLQIPSQRVAVRGADAITQVQFKTRKKMGPEMVTPIGIAVAAIEHPVRYLAVTVNERPVRLFDLRRLTIGDAAIAAGIELKRLHGKPGLAYSILINGQLRLFPGTHGNPPVITRNGENASLGSEIKDGDVILIAPGEDGTSPHLQVKDVVQDVTTLDLIVNGVPYSFPPEIRVNGKEADLSTYLGDRDEVTIHLPTRIGDLLPSLIEKLSLSLPLNEEITYLVNGEERKKKGRETQFLLNDHPAHLNTTLHQGDHLEVIQMEKPLTLKEILASEGGEPLFLHILFNGEPIHIPITQRTVMVNGVEANDVEQPISHGDVISIKTISLPNPCFRDIFRYVNFTLPKTQPQQKVVLLQNGEITDLDRPIKEGDSLEIRFLPIK